MNQHDLTEQLSHVLASTHLESLGPCYRGKVRDCYVSEGQRILIATDRLSCFDRAITTIPFKGEVLTKMAAFWFEKTQAIAPNHLIRSPHPNVMVVTDCEIVPYEVIVRGYLAGSLWKAYKKGEDPHDIKLPKGMKEYSSLSQPMVTPSTKEADAHDLNVSNAQVKHSGKVSAKHWDEICRLSLSLFEVGSRFAEERGLILADTKYEFGIRNGEILLADEIHTLDCSRYWVSETYEQRKEDNSPPEMLDKQVVREWLLDQGYSGEGTPPPVSDEKRVEIARHYITCYERITGLQFSGHVGNVEQEIEAVFER